MTTAWPFGADADEHDPLTELRIAVTGSHPSWCYLVAFHSYLEEYKTYWYSGSYLCKLADRPLDVDGGANGMIFRKYAEGDWGYRRRSWTRGPMFIPQPPRIRERYPDEAPLGPMTLEQVMDHAHTIVDGVDKRWLDWKTAHPEAFPT